MEANTCLESNVLAQGLTQEITPGSTYRCYYCWLTGVIGASPTICIGTLRSSERGTFSFLAHCECFFYLPSEIFDQGFCRDCEYALTPGCKLTHLTIRFAPLALHLQLILHNECAHSMKMKILRSRFSYEEIEENVLQFVV